MKAGQQIRQGDILFTMMNELPNDINASNTHEINGNNLIIAHSESGHHHVIERDKVQAYVPKTGAELIAYILVTEDTVVRHLKTGPDQHKPLNLPKGKYKVTRGRESMPDGFRRVAD